MVGFPLPFLVLCTGLPEGRIQPVRRIPNTEGLTDKERVLLTQLRESLFERHAKMKTMFSVRLPS